MTTYDEWRVTGTPLRRSVEQTYSGEDFTDPEGAARWYMAAATGPAPWVDGPHLHRRTVTVTDWELAVASLGVDEDAPPARAIQPHSAENASGVGRDRPDAHSGSQAPHATCIDVTNIRAGRPPGSERLCGPDCPREPERKADQAYTCPDHPGPLDDPTGHACRLRPARDERTTP